MSQQWTIQQDSQAVGMNYDYAKDIFKAYNQRREKAIALSCSDSLKSQAIAHFRRVDEPAMSVRPSAMPEGRASPITNFVEIILKGMLSSSVGRLIKVRCPF